MFIACFLLLLFHSLVAADQFEPVLYGDVMLANCTESLLKVKSVPIKVYEFKYDSVEGRKQMGVIAFDAERIFPESLEVIPSYTIPGREKGLPSIHVKNFPMIDKNVLFMHGFAAVKELIDMYDSFRLSLKEVENSGTDQHAVFQEIERRLSREADNQVIEEQRLAQVEAELLQAELLVLEQRKLDEEAAIGLELEEERKVLAYQEELLNIRCVS